VRLALHSMLSNSRLNPKMGLFLKKVLSGHIAFTLLIIIMINNFQMFAES